MPGDLSDPQDALEERLVQASARVEALEGFAFDTARLRRMLDEAREGARRGMPSQAGGLADDLETRLRMAEEELREASQVFFKSSWGLLPSAELSADGLRRAVLEETMGLIQSTLASQAFRELTEAAASATAREIVSREATALGEKVQSALAAGRESIRSETAGLARELRAESARSAGAARQAADSIESRLAQLEAAVTRKVEEKLKEDNSQAALDAETAERQIASVETSLASLEDRLCRVESASKPSSAPGPDLAALERRLSTLESRSPIPGAAPETLDPLVRRTERLERALESLRAPLERVLASSGAALDPAVLAAGLKGEVEAMVHEAAARSLAPLLGDMAQKLASVPTSESLQAAVLKAGEAMDARLTDRLGELLAHAPASSATPDVSALLAPMQAMIQQAMAEAFPVEELGKIIDQKVAKRSEALRNELREIEAGLVKAVMQQLDAKPASEAQMAALVDQRVNQLLLKYIQR